MSPELVLYLAGVLPVAVAIAFVLSRERDVPWDGEAYVIIAVGAALWPPVLAGGVSVGALYGFGWVVSLPFRRRAAKDSDAVLP